METVVWFFGVLHAVEDWYCSWMLMLDTSTLICHSA